MDPKANLVFAGMNSPSHSMDDPIIISAPFSTLVCQTFRFFYIK